MIVEYYRELAEGRSEPDKILVVSRSVYGLTKKAVEAALTEIRRLGYRLAYYRFNELEYSSPAEMIGEAIDSGGIIIASSTYEAGICPPIEYLIMLISGKIPQSPF